MVKLTEQMVIARTKQSNLGLITKFNCCGASISDASIIRHMPNVTVLSLSVNNISSLEVFKWCSKLQELFVRRNNIRELNQVCFLQELKHLKHLWLAENPCVKDSEDIYRLTIIKALPRLRKLDNQNVEENELERALRHPRVLIHPEKLKSEEYYSEPDSDEKESEVAAEPEVVQPLDDGAWDQKEVLRVQQESNWQDPARVIPEVAEPVRNDHRSQPERYYEPPPARHANERRYESDGQTYSSELPRQQIEYTPVSPDRGSPEMREWPIKNEVEETEDVEEVAPQTCREEPREPDILTRSSSFKNEYPVSNARGGSHYSSIPRSRTADEFGYCRRSAPRSNCSNNCSRRITDRKPNILNAILCLVKELDYQNLAVVEHAVKCRMDELDG